MSSSSRHRPQPARLAPRARRAARRAARRRRLAASSGCWRSWPARWLLSPLFNHAVEEITLPLRHEDIIRQQAREKGLDPALIAARHLRRVAVRRGRTSRPARRA